MDWATTSESVASIRRCDGSSCSKAMVSSVAATDSVMVCSKTRRQVRRRRSDCERRNFMLRP